MKRILTDHHNHLIYLSDRAAADFMTEHGYRETAPDEWAKRGGMTIIKVNTQPITALIVSSTNPSARGVEFTYSLDCLSPMALLAVKVHLIESDISHKIGQGLKLVESPIWDSQVDIWGEDVDSAARHAYYTSHKPDSEECQPVSWFNLWNGETLKSVNAYDIIARIEARAKKKQPELRALLGVSASWKPHK